MSQLVSTLRGLGVALVTPFHPDGKVDYPALQRLVEHQIKGSTDFLVVLGTTGETPTLSLEEQRRIVDFVLEVNANRLPVVVGITGNATDALCKRVASFDAAGVAAYLVASPAYNRPTQEGIIRHFERVADAASRPVMLYNVPARTGSNMTAETTLALSKHNNVCGIKEASGDLGQIAQILANRPEEFAVWSGDDALAMPTVAMGAEGVISVIGNAFPSAMSSMIQQAAFGQMHEARATHTSLTNLIKLAFEEGNPAGIKCALNHLGICSSQVRLPLVEASKALMDRMYAAIAALDVPATK
jgi:4-hydroxy-tetrahydrodipicolinate synthase